MASKSYRVVVHTCQISPRIDVAHFNPMIDECETADHVLQHQAEHCSNDSDFGRFPGLRWTNPLKEL